MISQIVELFVGDGDCLCSSIDRCSSHPELLTCCDEDPRSKDDEPMVWNARDEHSVDLLDRLRSSKRSVLQV